MGLLARPGAEAKRMDALRYHFDGRLGRDWIALVLVEAVQDASVAMTSRGAEQMAEGVWLRTLERNGWHNASTSLKPRLLL